jgi:hypothetical protein
MTTGAQPPSPPGGLDPLLDTRQTPSAVVGAYLGVTLLVSIDSLDPQLVCKPPVAVHDERNMLGEGLTTKQQSH